MRPPLALCLVACLAACASPDRAYWGREPQRVTLDGRDYVVYLRPETTLPSVQVIRVGYARRAEHAAILEAMQEAAESVSGCELRSGTARGDSGVMTAALQCPPG